LSGLTLGNTFQATVSRMCPAMDREMLRNVSPRGGAVPTRHNESMPFVRFADVIAELPHVDDPDVLERAGTNRALRIALEMARPRNWWGIGLDPNVLFTIAREDGIPVAWIPRGSILKELAAVPDPTARRQILLDRQAEIVEDCLDALDECRDPWLDDHVILARRAVQAYREGHHEAGMALAVNIGEPLAVWASTPRVRGFDSEADRNAWEKYRKKIRKYAWAEYELAAVGVDVSRYLFKQQVLMAPIPRFFTPWYPEGSDPAPEHLSRHVVAHQPTVKHFSLENALVALMLTVSILREQQAWAEDVRSMEIDPSE
jgi:hypothetical protein